MRLRVAAAISLLIHIVIGLMLLVTIRHQPRPEVLPPPSSVTMLFDSGSKTGPILPQPQQDTLAQPAPAPQAEPPLPEPPAPPPAEVPLAVQPASPPAEESSPAQPPPPAVEAPPPAEAPLTVQPPPPSVEEPPATETPVSPSPEPAPPLSPPTVPAPSVPIQPPPEPAPKTVPPPSTSPSARTSPSKPPVPAQAKHAPPPKAANFPPPMNFSFGSPQRPRPQPSPHTPGTIDLSLGPAKQGPADNTPHAMIDGDKAGPDWRNALSLWVSQHAYYPEQARDNHEEGEARVHVEATSRGRVTSVELLDKSGSMWLDLALQALFRNANIPPLPGGHTEPIEFNFTMRYILRYR